MISAEIPDNDQDPLLHEIVTKNVMHDPCGILNPNSPCMVDGKCSKRFPRQLVAETISGNDGYPLFRQRSTDDNGRSTIFKVDQLDIEVDNLWVVPFWQLLSKSFKAHMNVEYYHSLKSIKYICKYAKVVIRLCSELLLKIQTVRSFIFKWDAMSVVTRRCGVFFFISNT